MTSLLRVLFKRYQKAFSFRSRRQVFLTIEEFYVNTTSLVHHQTQATGYNVKCQKGCSHCCSQHVSIYTPEVFYIVDKMRDAFSESTLFFLSRRLSREAAKPDKTDRKRCVFSGLKSGACVIYPFRPANCRKYVSDDVEKCRKSGGLITQPEAVYLAEGLHAAALTISALDEGLHADSHEMNQALACALNEPGLLKKWLNGEKNIIPPVSWEHYTELLTSNRDFYISMINKN